MTAPLILCRDNPSVPLPVDSAGKFALPADGWFQVSRSGELEAPLEAPGREPVNVIQVLDASAATTVLAAFAADRAVPNFSGLLVDFEHKSETDDEDTRAAMWIEDMQVREGGELWIKGRLTDSGTTAIAGGDYRHISPVFEYPIRNYSSGERVRPARLRSAGLTNRPRIKGMLPLSNRETASASAAAAKPNSKPEDKKPMNPEVLTLLGLKADASPEEVVAAIRALKEKSDQLAPVTQQRDSLLGAAVERDLDDAGLQGAARAPWKTALTTNREGTLPLLASVKAAKPAGDASYRVTHNRDTAKAPAAAPDAAEETSAAKARGAKIANRATELRKANPRLSRSQAFAKAESEIGA